MRLVQSTSNLSPVMAAIAEAVATDASDSFQEQRSPFGLPWEPLKPETLARRRGTGAQILLDTGRLRGSIHSTHGNDFAEVSANAIYAATHQFGRGAIPARPFMPINDNHNLPDGLQNDIVDMIDGYLRRAVA